MIERVSATTVVSPYKSPDIVVLTMLIFLFEKFPNLVIYEYINHLQYLNIIGCNSH